MTAADPTPDPSRVAPVEPAPREPTPVEPAQVPEQRLHPLSWLFVLVQQLRHFMLPLLVLLLLGRGDRNELWGLIGVGVLALVSIWQYYTYRYRIDADRLIVRSGLLERTQRQIPFSRIHNVALHQTLLHRMFDVAEVRLESAGGKRPEAEMRVLRLAEATALEALIRRHAHATVSSHDGATIAGDNASESGSVLLHLPLREIIRLGLLSNRGLLVVGAGLAALSQLDANLLEAPIERYALSVARGLDVLKPGVAQYGLAALAFVLVAVLVLQLLSVALAILQYTGFRLIETGTRLTIERGLLTRVRTSASRRRIQAWTLKEGLLQRLFGRRSLLVETAVSRAQSEQRAFRDIAPIAVPAACDALVNHLLPHVQWPQHDWHALHPRAWWRMAVPGLLIGAALTLVLLWNVGGWGWLGLAWWPCALLAAYRNGQRAGYVVDIDLVAMREGWLSRHWRFAELDKLQVLHLRRSPIDRMTGMASLWLDTAGAGSFAPPLRIRFLPHAVAQALQARLTAEIAQRPLRW